MLPDGLLFLLPSNPRTFRGLYKIATNFLYSFYPFFLAKMSTGRLGQSASLVIVLLETKTGLGSNHRGKTHFLSL